MWFRASLWRGAVVVPITLLQCLAVGAWTLAALDASHAQTRSAQRMPSPRIGFLDGVRGVKQQSDCNRPYALRADPGAIRLERQSRELAVTPVDSAVIADRLRVRRYSDLRFRVDAPRFGAGTFFFSPEAGRCTQAANGLRDV